MSIIKYLPKNNTGHAEAKLDTGLFVLDLLSPGKEIRYSPINLCTSLSPTPRPLSRKPIRFKVNTGIHFCITCEKAWINLFGNLPNNNQILPLWGTTFNVNINHCLAILCFPSLSRSDTCIPMTLHIFKDDDFSFCDDPYSIVLGREFLDRIIYMYEKDYSYIFKNS